MYIIIQYFVFQICKMSVINTVQKASHCLIVNLLLSVSVAKFDKIGSSVPDP
jgi:hypothetical protein